MKVYSMLAEESEDSDELEDSQGLEAFLRVEMNVEPWDTVLIVNQVLWSEEDADVKEELMDLSDLHGVMNRGFTGKRIRKGN